MNECEFKGGGTIRVYIYIVEEKEGKRNPMAPTYFEL